MAAIVLRPGREKSLRKRHPWIFSGAVERIDDAAVDGSIAEVVDAQGRFLARASVNRASQIVGRVVTWDEAETIDEAFWRRRLVHAIEARPAEAAAVRLVNAESDGLPGLVVDRYGEWLVMQALTLGADRAKREIARIVAESASSGGRAAVRGVWERSDVDIRAREGLAKEAGPLWGEEPPAEIDIEETAADGRSLRFAVDVRRGHKTGFYLDQRENRPRVARWGAGREVLDLFGYTGAFVAHALAAGARLVEMVDSSLEAIAVAPRNVERNALPGAAHFVRENVFEFLRRARGEGRRFGMVIADPPKLAKTQAHLDKATRAYKDLNLLAMQVLEPGGILATFSCSGLVSADLFRKIVFGASVDAGRDVQILDRLGQPADHPVLLGLPEAEYLKGLVCRVE